MYYFDDLRRFKTVNEEKKFGCRRSSPFYVLI